jgi:hypothetical protein
MDINTYLTPKRKSILINGLVFGAIAALGALSVAFPAGKPVDLTTLGTVLLMGFVGGFVGYFNSEATEFETGARGSDGKFVKARPKTKIGL